MNTSIHPKYLAQSGYLSVQGVAGLLATLVVLSIFAALWSFGMSMLRGRAAAQQLVVVAEAAQHYARLKGLLHSLTPGAAAQAVTTTELTTEGLLPPPATGTMLTNAWGQHYTIYYHVPLKVPPASPTLTVVIVSVDGEVLSDKDASLISFAGASAGVVMSQPSGDILRGVGGGYAIPLAAAPMLIPSPGPGHVGYYASLDDAALLSDTLYRVAVPGRPELNQMRVDLDMSNQSLLDVKSVQFNATSIRALDLTTICGTTPDEIKAAEGKVFFYTDAGVAETADHALDGLYACRQGQPQQVADAGNSSLMRTTQTVTDGTSIATPQCPPGLSPFISVSPAALPTGMSFGQTLYSSYTGTGAVGDPWVVHLARYDLIGNILPTIGGSVSVITSCGR